MPCAGGKQTLSQLTDDRDVESATWADVPRSPATAKSPIVPTPIRQIRCGWFRREDGRNQARRHCAPAPLGAITTPSHIGGVALATVERQHGLLWESVRHVAN